MACIPLNQYSPFLHEVISGHDTEAECVEECGVCCLPDGSCVDNTQTQCTNAGGSWNPGVTCVDVICPFPSPSPSPSPPPSPSPSPSVISECEVDEDCTGGWHCCGNKCYPYQILCTVMGPGTPTEACKQFIQNNGGSVDDCCPDLGYTVIGSTFDLSGEVLLSVNCAAPYPDCSDDNEVPIYSNPVEEGYSVVNCLPDPYPP